MALLSPDGWAVCVHRTAMTVGSVDFMSDDTVKITWRTYSHPLAPGERCSEYGINAGLTTDVSGETLEV